MEGHDSAITADRRERAESVALRPVGGQTRPRREGAPTRQAAGDERSTPPSEHRRREAFHHASRVATFEVASRYLTRDATGRYLHLTILPLLEQAGAGPGKGRLPALARLGRRRVQYEESPQ